MLLQDGGVFGIGGEVDHLAGVFDEVDEGFAILSFAVDDVFEAVSTDHAALGFG